MLSGTLTVANRTSVVTTPLRSAIIGFAKVQGGSLRRVGEHDLEINAGESDSFRVAIYEDGKRLSLEGAHAVFVAVDRHGRVAIRNIIGQGIAIIDDEVEVFLSEENTALRAVLDGRLSEVTLDWEVRVYHQYLRRTRTAQTGTLTITASPAMGE